MENDDKIKQVLQNIKVPTPSSEAQKITIFEALNEFDKKSAKNTQGYSFFSRLKDITNQIDRGINMKNSTIYKGAATAMVLVIGVIGWSEFQATTGKQVYQVPLEESASVAGKKTDVAMDKSSSRNKDEALNSVSPPPPSVAAPMLAAPSGAFTNAKPKMEMAEKKAYGGSADGLIGSPYVAQEIEGDVYAPTQQIKGNDKFEKTKTNPVKLVTEDPVSTFSIDVDTSSYSFIRRQLNYGTLPSKDAVRIEEMVNYFDYNYPLPESKTEPFKPSVTVMPSPWHKGNQIMHIGIKGYDIAPTQKPHSNLVFLIDTSGSMQDQDKLPLLINSFGMLVDTLGANDTVSIVTYAGSAGTVLEPTKASNKAKILAALSNLSAGGSTAGAEGIKQAYALAEQNFDKSGVNRVILATDGDFNVGVSDPEELKTYIEKKSETGVFLSVLGFGQGNYNDELMQKLAQNGNGNAAYIDNINEARKVLVQEASSTLFPIAKDVKIQVEFNKDLVSEYRLIGYETRILNREDFNNDKVDAGEIGSGHAVTAIYEFTPKGEKGLIDAPRYGNQETTVNIDKNVKPNEYGFLKIRYKLPNESTSKLITTPIPQQVATDETNPVTNEAKFATAVAAFGQLLKGESYVGDFSFDDVVKLAESAKGEDKFGYRAEFINLVKTAKAAKSIENLAPVGGGDEPLPRPTPLVIQ